MKYYKKPIPVEAFKWDNDVEVPEWFTQAYKDNCVKIAGNQIYIDTLEGLMIADKGYWIIKGIDGELYPCRPDIFERSYEVWNENKQVV